MDIDLIILQFSEAFSMTLKIPEGCQQEDCDYFLGLKQDEKDSNLLHFVLEGKSNGWLAIGFSHSPSMVCKIPLHKQLTLYYARFYSPHESLTTRYY